MSAGDEDDDDDDDEEDADTGVGFFFPLPRFCFPLSTGLFYSKKTRLTQIPSFYLSFLLSFFLCLIQSWASSSST